MMLGVMGCNSDLTPSASSKNESIVEFKDREINLYPYFKAFPYRNFSPFYAAGKLYYYHEEGETHLKEIELDKKMNLSLGTKISTIDFATRNVWGIQYRSLDGNLYWRGDQYNDEVINLYRLNPRNRKIEQLTEVPYIYGWQWEVSQQHIAYVARLGRLEDRLGELRIMDLEVGREQVILKDTPELRFTWGPPSWQPGGKGLVIPALKQANREYGNLLFIDLETREATLLTDSTMKRDSPTVLKEWLDNQTFIYISNESGYRNIYRYDLEKMTSTAITQFKKDVKNVEILQMEDGPLLFATINSPIENELLLIDPFSGEILNRELTDENITILDVVDNTVLATVNSVNVMFRMDEIFVTTESFDFRPLTSIPSKLEKQIIHAKVERIEYPTFDIDPATGKQRMIHAYLYVPNKPLPKDRALGLVQSFYGGGNVFSIRNQILAEAGIYVLSPAPRGSRGFGREFSSLNDKDLGGNEIVDIIYAGKYLADRLDIPQNQIGVFGGSHGGYATMRLLTFPGKINGFASYFDWGFGISHAGFSDIIDFYENCNIPDWVTLEAGDPETEAPKLQDRSPINHADKLLGKLLMTHGTQDRRVPISGSRRMADSLRKYNKPFSLVEFEGQGHSIKGLDNNIRNYQTWFQFLESL